MTPNLRGAALMTLAMALFALEDMMIKIMAGDWPIGQIVLALGIGGTPVFAVMAWRQGHSLWHRDLVSAPVILRNVAELIGTFGFVTAIALIPLSTASAILQSAPLVVTVGAALFLGEQVGWRRWTAILIGLFGVLLIIRPGMQGFDPLALWAVVGMLGLAARDVIVRKVPARVHTLQLAFLGFATLIPTGLLLLLAGGTPLRPAASDTAIYALIAIVLGVCAYYAILIATRIGEVSFVTPFRYTRMVFALIIGVLIFGERPDLLMLIGSAIVIASGIYTLWREGRHRNR
ncbi:DMT family transporter [Shimia ponticola]|uniref:DMT family transporter n=1 Tax=Shimia ponticola TaxID=2582893 RepID=UPI0011BDADEE|nr:DMT family transporter [Shimia ponticola]